VSEGGELLGRLASRFMEAPAPAGCSHVYEFSTYCGADVCVKCGDHKGLGRCFCGWNLAVGERLEDDVDE
jgi:hypothetical protein